MGWAHCGLDEHGREIGYGVEAECDEPGCGAVIDRGLGHLCGRMHGDGESCNGYFCADHLILTDLGQRCGRCSDMDVIDEVMES